MISFFKPSSVIDSDSSDWLFEQFAILLEQLGAEHFITKAPLVLPTAQFFPASAKSPGEMAAETLIQMKTHAGMSQWPIDLVTMPTTNTLPQLEFKQGYYGDKAQVLSDYTSSNRIELAVDLTKFSNPQSLVATLSQQLSAILLAYMEYKPQSQEYLATTEVLGCFLGFGLMLTNSSYQFRGGCGSCYNASAKRDTGLNEDEMLYALAIFCQLKGISNKEVMPHLKRYLRAGYKKSVRDIVKNQPQFLALKTML